VKDDANKPLAQALREAAKELSALEAPPAVWSGVRAAFERAHPPRPAWRRPLAWSGAATCAAVLFGSALLMQRPQPVETAWPQARSSGFVPLLPVQAWGDGPAWLVAAEMPSERLAALGLPYDPAHAGERVQAELLMHASGEVLAVRLVR